MKSLKWKHVVALLAGLSLTGSFAVMAESSDEDIVERIKPAGQVRMAGESNQAQASASSDEERSGEQVYNQACAACHAGGVLGAPKHQNADDWSERLSKGMETLLRHSIEGFNAMPPRGGCGNCSDDEIEAAIVYMTDGL